MHAEIKVGDVVRLKSGGPEMTVKNIGKGTLDDQLLAWCDWFDGKKPMKDSFPLTSLEKA